MVGVPQCLSDATSLAVSSRREVVLTLRAAYRCYALRKFAVRSRPFWHAIRPFSTKAHDDARTISASLYPFAPDRVYSDWQHPVAGTGSVSESDRNHDRRPRAALYFLEDGQQN